MKAAILPEQRKGKIAREKEKSIVKNCISADRADYCDTGNLSFSDAFIQWNKNKSGSQYHSDGRTDGWKKCGYSGK